ncbi:hypothetical protein BST81_00840 [Leptolyngbya sp. 'hensonii']|nr:hypothetical protein BST81_00840 [Leptolyngbya sp. 'hensonii']
MGSILITVALLLLPWGTPLLVFPSLTLAQSPSQANPKAEAQRLNQLALQQYRQGQIQKALQTFQQELQLRRDVGDRSGEGTALNNIGEVLLTLGQFQTALESYRQALDIARELRDRPRERVFLGNLGKAYYSLGQYPQALDFYQQSLTISREVNDRVGEGILLNNIGLTYSRLSQQSKALDYYQQALKIAREKTDQQTESTILGNIGLAYDNLGDYQNALTYYQQSFDISRTIGDRIGQGYNLTRTGTTFAKMGNYPKALEFLQQALDLRQEIGDQAGVAYTLNSLGLVYDNLGQYAKALQYYQQARVIQQEIGDRFGEGITLSNIGAIYRTQGNRSAALKTYRQALDIARAIGNRSGEGTALSNIGDIYTGLEDYSLALQHNQQALEIARQIGNQSLESTALNNISYIYIKTKQYAQALEVAQQSLKIKVKIGDQTGKGISLNNIGFIYNQLNQFKQAEETLLQAIQIWESLRPGLTDENKVSLFESQPRTYWMLGRSLIAQSKPELALEVVERSRARAFVELLATRLAPGQTNPGTVVPPKIQQIQQIATDQKATLVEYSIPNGDETQDRALYIWVVQPNGKITFRRSSLQALDDQKISLDQLVIQKREALGVRGLSFVASPTLEGQPSSARLKDPNLQELYRLLIDPIADVLPQDPQARVIFVPQRSLFFVPFAALQDASGKYLIERHTISIAPSIQVLQLTRQQRQRLGSRSAGGNILVMGNPTMPKLQLQEGEAPQQLPNLPGAEKEARAIAALFKTNAITGDRATKAALLPRLQQARIIHLATHGLLNDIGGLGMPGAIALAPTSTDSGFLTAADLFKLNLQAELVVLSACDTGRGQVTEDGIIGLSRSLISAGSPSVIVSLWKVQDEATSLLMTQFYQNLLQGQNKAQALRQAMLTLATHKDAPYPPTAWAAFVLIGEAE